MLQLLWVCGGRYIACVTCVSASGVRVRACARCRCWPLPRDLQVSYEEAFDAAVAANVGLSEPFTERKVLLGALGKLEQGKLLEAVSAMSAVHSSWFLRAGVTV